MTQVVHQLRYWYRKLVLLMIPVRAYIVSTPLRPEVVRQRLETAIYPDPLYFIRTINKEYAYSGRFDGPRFTAIRNGRRPWQRRIKIRGKIILDNGQTYVSLIMSTPLSPFNFLFLGIFYIAYLFMYPQPFRSALANLALLLLPLLLGIMATNLSFRGIYRKEKLMLFKLLEGTRIPDSQAKDMGYW